MLCSHGHRCPNSVIKLIKGKGGRACCPVPRRDRALAPRTAENTPAHPESGEGKALRKFRGLKQRWEKRSGKRKTRVREAETKKAL